MARAGGGKVVHQVRGDTGLDAEQDASQQGCLRLRKDIGDSELSVLLEGNQTVPDRVGLVLRQQCDPRAPDQRMDALSSQVVAVVLLQPTKASLY